MSHRQLAADDLHVGYPGSAEVLRGATLTLAPGRRTAVLGGNGSGKTTLLRCLSGALRPRTGRVLLDGVPLRYDRAGLRRHRQAVQLVLQDPDDQLFSASVHQDVSFGPMNLDLPEAEVRSRVAEALGLLSVGHLADRPVHRLSHGERQRVAVAGALAMRPCVLLLDEPTSGLDPAATVELLAALERLESHGTRVVLSTHDVDLALAWADDVAVVTGGRVVQGAAELLLGDADLLAACRLTTPLLLRLADGLARRGWIAADAAVPRRVDDLLAALAPAAGAPPPLARTPDTDLQES
ncbi:energy-coupling factor ABC transporter ATP-binding protein [Thalassiella azotivora]